MVSKCASLSCRLQERSPMPAPRPGYSSAESGIESPVDRAAFDAALGEVQICLASRDRPVSQDRFSCCLLYTSDAADDLLCVDLGGRRIIKKKKKKELIHNHIK